MNIQGKLSEKYEAQDVSESFRKREFVVEYYENPQFQQYPEFIKFQLVQTNCELLNAFEVGDEISVSFNLKGRKWVNPEGQTVFFNTLQAWRLDKGQGNQTAPNTNQAPSSNKQQNTPPPQSNQPPTNEEDDLPF